VPLRGTQRQPSHSKVVHHEPFGLTHSLGTAKFIILADGIAAAKPLLQDHLTTLVNARVLTEEA
jgi:hypothetical protein